MMMCGKWYDVITVSWRHALHMPTANAKRVTVYFDLHAPQDPSPQGRRHRALRSDLVNEAVRALMAEDADDLAAIEERAGDPGPAAPPHARAEHQRA